MSVLDLFRLDGKRAVVTGAAQGIGFAIAQALKEAGAKVIIADMNEDLGRLAATKLGATFQLLDVREPESVKNAVDVLDDVDILVNNAGIVRNTPAEDATTQEWRDVMGVNLDGVYWCCREFGSGMLARGKGSLSTLHPCAALSVTIRSRRPVTTYRKQASFILPGPWRENGRGEVCVSMRSRRVIPAQSLRKKALRLKNGPRSLTSRDRPGGRVSCQ